MTLPTVMAIAFFVTVTFLVLRNFKKTVIKIRQEAVHLDEAMDKVSQFFQNYLRLLHLKSSLAVETEKMISLCFLAAITSLVVWIVF